MYSLLSSLVLYRNLADDSVLADVAGVYRDLAARRDPAGDLPRDVRCDLAARANAAAKRLLDLATTYGFDRDLWADYLAFCLLTDENSFSLTAERRGAVDGGSVNALARADLSVFLELLRWDFSDLSTDLGAPAFESLCNWKSIPKQRANYFEGVSREVRSLSDALAACAADGGPDAPAHAFALVSDAYRRLGVGLFGLNAAFRIRRTEDALLRDDDLQKERLVANTQAFLAGRPANNVLLYGDAGTGKSTCVKALLTEYADAGLRIIEIYKYQFRDLSRVIEAVKHRNYRFIVFIDDLSFEENEVEYKFLKAVIEGGVEQRPENVLIYATSNRRHLIRETWNDRNDIEHDGDVHRSDTVEEKLSLAERFGVSINFSTPAPKLYHQIVLELAARELPGRFPDEAELLKLADRWEIRHGGMSGRTARQFIDYLAGE